MSAPTQLFGLPLFNGPFAAAVDDLAELARARQGPARVAVTPNVDHVISLHDDPALHDLYRGADRIYPDGYPVVLAARICGRAPIRERITGTDLMHALCERFRHEPLRVFVYGGRPGEEAAVATGLQARFPGLTVRVRCPAAPFVQDAPDDDAAVGELNAYRPHLVLACFASMQQERWALQRRGELDAGLVLCCGSGLDYALGRATRCPRWLRERGFEWLWRLLSEPRRLAHRYLVRGPRFLPLLWREWRAGASAAPQAASTNG